MAHSASYVAGNTRSTRRKQLGLASDTSGGGGATGVMQRPRPVHSPSSAEPMTIARATPSHVAPLAEGSAMISASPRIFDPSTLDVLPQCNGAVAGMSSCLAAIVFSVSRPRSPNMISEGRSRASFEDFPFS